MKDRQTNGVLCFVFLMTLVLNISLLSKDFLWGERITLAERFWVGFPAAAILLVCCMYKSSFEKALKEE